MASRTAGVAFAIAAGFLGTAVLVVPRAVVAAEDCLTEPTGEKTDAQRWYYRFDRGTNRRCWYLKDANGNTTAPVRAGQQPAPWDFAQPAPPKLTPKRADGPVVRSSDALAETPQPRLRTDLAVRGTPRPQNVAITPTTLTASDASLPRNLDTSPWSSAPPQPAEPTTTGVAPAAMADDGNLDPDANTPPSADGPIISPAKSSKPEAPIHVLMLVVIGALAISGLLASALYRLSRMGRQRRRNGSWHADARARRGRMKSRPKTHTATQTAMRGNRGGSAAPAGSGRSSYPPQSALDLASARLSAADPEPVDPRVYRPAHPAPQQDHPALAARRRDRDAADEMQRTQANDEAVWQAVDQLADRIPSHGGPVDAARPAPTPDAQPFATAPLAPAPRTQMTAAQIAAIQMAAAQAANAKIAAPPIPAGNAPAASGPQSPPYHTAPMPPVEPWPNAQRGAPAGPPPNQAAMPFAPAPAPEPASAPPAPVDVGEIVSALRKARAGEAGPAAGGGAPVDAAKVIAALLVSRAAKRRAAQSGPDEAGAARPAAGATTQVAPQPAADVAAVQTMQAAQHLIDRFRDGREEAGQPAPLIPAQAMAAPEAAQSGDPAAALIETLRAHAARQPTYERDGQEHDTPAGRMPMSNAPASAEDDELDDPAAALINLLQSRFSLPEDELEPDTAQDTPETSAPEPPQTVAHFHEDPAAQLLSMLESRSSIPAAPTAVERQPPPQRQQQPQRQQPQPQRQQPVQQRRPQFAPAPFEDPASPPLDFIPRPQALRPRAHSIQHDESLDGIQDILARLGRRA